MLLTNSHRATLGSAADQLAQGHTWECCWSTRTGPHLSGCRLALLPSFYTASQVPRTGAGKVHRVGHLIRRHHQRLPMLQCLEVPVAAPACIPGARRLRPCFAEHMAEGRQGERMLGWACLPPRPPSAQTTRRSARWCHSRSLALEWPARPTAQWQQRRRRP